MKIFDLLLEPDFDFFLNIKLGGNKLTRPVYLHPAPCILDMSCDMLLRSIK